MDKLISAWGNADYTGGELASACCIIAASLVRNRAGVQHLTAFFLAAMQSSMRISTQREIEDSIAKEVRDA